MATLFRPALDLMAQYAAYHRDRRNIATHFVGIPMIVFAVCTLLARAEFEIADTPMNAAIVVWALSSLWYLTRGNVALGGATAIVNAVLTALAMTAAQGSTSHWLLVGVGSFVVGWIIQFIGHYYEGRKPAFVDDLVGLLVGPMFVVGELMFMLGWGSGLLAEIEKRVGPTHIRDLAHPV
jgi:uncharacterized membrane protein YGL010W